MCCVPVSSNVRWRLWHDQSFQAEGAGSYGSSLRLPYWSLLAATFFTSAGKRSLMVRCSLKERTVIRTWHMRTGRIQKPSSVTFAIGSGAPGSSFSRVLLFRFVWCFFPQSKGTIGFISLEKLREGYVAICRGLWRSWYAWRCLACWLTKLAIAACRQRGAQSHLTLRSIGHLPACYPRFPAPLMSNVRRQQCHALFFATAFGSSTHRGERRTRAYSMKTSAETGRLACNSARSVFACTHLASTAGASREWETGRGFTSPRPVRARGERPANFLQMPSEISGFVAMHYTRSSHRRPQSRAPRGMR